MAVRLEVGKRYVDGLGEVHGPMVASGLKQWPFSSGDRTYSAYGIYVVDPHSTSNLVREYKEAAGYLIHVYAPPEASQMLRLSPHLQIPADTPQRTTYGPVQLPEHIVAGLQDPKRQQRMLSALVAEHGHKIVRIELEKVD